jgi:hypothetical protein
MVIIRNLPANVKQPVTHKKKVQKWLPYTIPAPITLLDHSDRVKEHGGAI